MTVTREALLPVFRFQVDFAEVSLASGQETGEVPLCRGAFAEVSGIEATMEAKTVAEGGCNYGEHQRAGRVSFATVVLRRGMTESPDPWRWFALVAGGDGARGGAHAHRMNVSITLQDAAGRPVLTWRLERALPVKFRGADLDARGNAIGIEELHLVHEGLRLQAADRG